MASRGDTWEHSRRINELSCAEGSMIPQKAQGRQRRLDNWSRPRRNTRRGKYLSIFHQESFHDGIKSHRRLQR